MRERQYVKEISGEIKKKEETLKAMEKVIEEKNVSIDKIKKENLQYSGKIKRKTQSSI